MLYVCETKPGTLISHDGHVQLGYQNMSLEEFLSLQKVDYLVVHWVPDIFKHRYKRNVFQHHMRASDGKDSIGGCEKLKDK